MPPFSVGVLSHQLVRFSLLNHYSTKEIVLTSINWGFWYILAPACIYSFVADPEIRLVHDFVMEIHTFPNVDVSYLRRENHDAIIKMLQKILYLIKNIVTFCS